jgi:hypothetical protein
MTSGNRTKNISYTYDSVGNITNITDHSDTGTGKVVNFVYDGLNRLTLASSTAASSTPFKYTYAYDALGNITGNGTSTATTTYAYAGRSARCHGARLVRSSPKAGCSATLRPDGDRAAFRGPL